ncbi:YdcF family protein [soil metagenome]
MKRALKYLFAISILWFSINTICIVVDGLTDEGTPADVAVILGSKVNEDGTLSPRLEARLRQGFELYRTGQVKILMVSGGTGKEGHPEGTVMAKYLIQWGVPAEDIVIDDHGNNTYQTVQNTRELRKTRGIESVVVVSQYFHISRTKMMYRKKGFKNVTGSHARHFEWRDPYSILREFAGYYEYWVRY